MLPEHPVPAPEFMELLAACLSNAGPGVTVAMRDLRNHLLNLSPEHLSGEIPTAQKPRTLLAPLLAMGCLAFFPITEQTAYKIRSDLEARRGRA